MRPLPKIWLMTDKRNDATLSKAIQNLPRESGIIFRHYHLNKTERAEKFAEVQKWARSKNHLLLLAGSPRLAKKWGADGVHGRQWSPVQKRDMLHSAPVHNVREIIRSKRNRADLFFLSQVFPTRSHPGAKTQSTTRLKQLANLCDGPVVLLGGMNENRFRQLRHIGAHGWAAIDALSNRNIQNDQKRKRVPT